ncbi:MAG: cobalamin-independent methionine synthase II family protein [Pseudonocardiales bacterium]|nr:cobalamin-independent methionine synthase II family protein [Pseudonocardiales bacterium]
MLSRENKTLTTDAAAQLPVQISAAVNGVVRSQLSCGLDVISDGEMSKIGYATYVKDRLSGFQEADVPEGGGLSIADLDDYPGMAETSLAGLTTATPTCTGPISYLGNDELHTDIANFRTALDGRNQHDRHLAGEPFLTAASPGVIALYLPNAHYPNDDDYLFALAEAMRTEYEAIVAAGFVLQIDAPDLATGRHILYTHLPLPEFQKRAEVHVEAINHAVRNIDPEQVRVHLCYGNYQGPHHRDVELRDIINIVLRLRPHGLVFEAANHRHAHEWKIFEQVHLPDEKLLVPGMIDTSSNYVEHPDLIAERITRYASLVGRERLLAGTDCGFASFASFLAVSPQLAWAKLTSLVHGAQQASSQLWRAATIPA